MPQFPALIELSDLDGTNGFQLSGEAAGDFSGIAVSGAGDVNGDGFADVIVGASGADPHGTSSGASYIVFGKASGFDANLDLSSLDGTNGFQISGEAADDNSGLVVANAGDVNGDGFADVIIGAYSADPNGANSGASYVVFGKASGFAADLDLSSLNGTNGFRISGETGGDFSGNSVASAGDVNGDGIDDLIVGASAADPHGSSSGASYVVFGTDQGFAANLSLSSLDGTNGFQINGEAASDLSGFAVDGAGDVNGDGFADLIIGAFQADPHGTSSGASYVVFGKAAGFGANLDLSSLDGSNGFQISGEAAGDASGRSVASAGDVNGDGFADLIIGAPRADRGGGDSGSSYVVFGKAAGFSPNLDVTALDGSNGFQVISITNVMSGFSVASAGDVNGDGFDDVLIGAPGVDPYGTAAGETYVVFGKASGFAATLDVASLDGTNGFQIDGEAAFDRAGASVSSAGDVNGDGFADLVIGANSADPHGDNSGASYVVFGRPPDTAVNRTGTNASQTLASGDSDDTLSGRGGDDRLVGNGGNDSLNGGAGKDTLVGGAGDDGLDGGGGNDTVDYSRAEGGVTVKLAAAGAQDTGGAGTDTLTSIENAVGGAFDDRLIGTDGANRLAGGGGADTLKGGAGHDILDGGAGRDVLRGGADADTFLFVALNDSPVGFAVRDRIADFGVGGDHIDLSAIDADTTAVADQAFSFIGSAAFTGSAGELHQVAFGAKTVLEGDVNGDGAADFQILLSGALTLSAGDFVL